MKTIEAYQTTDGELFECDRDATLHQQDLAGQAIDALMLLAVQAVGGDVTRNQQYRMCLHLLNNPGETMKLCQDILKHLGD